MGLGGPEICGKAGLAFGQLAYSINDNCETINTQGMKFTTFWMVRKRMNRKWHEKLQGFTQSS